MYTRLLLRRHFHASHMTRHKAKRDAWSVTRKDDHFNN